MRDPDALRDQREPVPRFDRRGHYDSNQPRVPAGHPDGGQWTETGRSADDTSSRSNDELVQLARFSPNRPSLIRPGHPIVTLLSLFAALSARNSPDRRAVFEFNAKEFLRDPQGERGQANVMVLDREDVENVCRKLEDVQRRTDRIADAVARENIRTGLAMSRSQIGSAVHVRLKKEIDSLGNPNYRAEVSYWKAEEDRRYGRKDSIRIDVLENVGDGLVCVYDVKTGLSTRSGLSPRRMKEIAEHVLKAYPHVQRIVITEVRPSR